MGGEKFLVYEAKSFYNAFIALEKLYLDGETNMLFFIPMLVNGAFSVEITLKAILYKNGIEYEKEHNLLNLFNMIPDSLKLEIMGHVREEAPDYEEIEQFAEELMLSSYAFEDWRYPCEDGPAPAINTRFLSALASASITTLLSYYDANLIPSMNQMRSDKEIEELFQHNRDACIQRNIERICKKEKGKKKVKNPYVDNT